MWKVIALTYPHPSSHREGRDKPSLFGLVPACGRDPGLMDKPDRSAIPCGPKIGKGHSSQKQKPRSFFDDILLVVTFNLQTQ
jgi:hypothetical protein